MAESSVEHDKDGKVVGSVKVEAEPKTQLQRRYKWQRQY
jgi:hypothetical protein